MRFEAFEARAHQLWRGIPARFREGVDGLVVSPVAHTHPGMPDVYTLGECTTEDYPSDFGGPETTRSILTLYHGSFVALARRDPDFDWDAELWETLTHELQHHLESLADENALESYDYAAEQHFRRLRGESFDPYFYRLGRRERPGLYEVEGDLYLEVEREMREVDPGGDIPFDWEGDRRVVSAPEHPGDVCFVRVTGGVGALEGELNVVVVVRPRFLDTVRALLSGRRPEVVEAESEARPPRG